MSFKLIIEKLKMKGFKQYKNEVIHNLKPSTTIYGDNDMGKTTIADAIAWCLCNANYDGKEKVTKTLTNIYSKAVEVSMLVKIINDKETVTREFKRVAGVDQDSDGFFINGKRMQSQYFINTLGIDKHVLFSMLNPSYFCSLSKADAKDTILKVIKKIEDKEVIDNLEPYQKEMLIKNGFKKDINSFMLQTKNIIKQLKEDIIYFDGVIDAKKERIKLPSVNKKELEERNKQLCLEIADLDGLIKNEYTTELKGVKEKDEHMKELYNLKQQLATLSAKTKASEINRLKGEIEYYNNYPVPQLPQTQDNSVSVLNQQIQSLRNKYAKLNVQLNQIDDINIKCSNCGNDIVLTNPKKKMLVQYKDEITNEGIEFRKNLEKLKQQNAIIKSNYDKELNKTKKFIINEIEKRNKQIEALKNQQDPIEIEQLKEKISSLEKDIANIESNLKKEKELKKEKISKLDIKMKKKMQESQKQNGQIITYNNLFSLEESRKEDLKKNEKYLEKTKKDYIYQKDVLSTIKIFIALKIKMQKSVLEKHLKHIDICLEKVVKSTGELKEDFLISYDGKEFNMLSRSGKIRAGLELVGMFTELKQIYIPTILDDAESITKYEPVRNCQLIEMRVKENSQLKLIG